MARKETIRFLRDVELLDFKFPVAEIAELTGYSKSNVSQYLKGKLEPSENFLKSFYKSLEKSDIKVPQETKTEEPEISLLFSSKSL
jgi:transcriptional regulator with XRE-family HTH domain